MRFEPILEPFPCLAFPLPRFHFAPQVPKSPPLVLHRVEQGRLRLEREGIERGLVAPQKTKQPQCQALDPREPHALPDRGRDVRLGPGQRLPDLHDLLPGGGPALRSGSRRGGGSYPRDRGTDLLGERRDGVVFFFGHFCVRG